MLSWSCEVECDLWTKYAKGFILLLKHLNANQKSPADDLAVGFFYLGRYFFGKVLLKKGFYVVSHYIVFKEDLYAWQFNFISEIVDH